MKKIILFSFLAISAFSASAQNLRDVLKKSKDSTGRVNIGKIIPGTNSAGLSAGEVVEGLKEALVVGTEKSAARLSSLDGFFKDAAIKILMPAEAQKAEKKLRTMGLGKQVDDAVLSMNRAAEDAAREVTPIFVNAIRQMTFEDAMGILRGGDFAATDYLKRKTTSQLTEAFRPVIENSLQKVNATKYWNTVFTTYNRFSTEKVNTDLVAYVTEKALAGIFYQVGLEEQKIRKDPFARTSDILKKVFAN